MSGSKRRVIYTQTHHAPGDVEDSWVQEVFREELPLPDKPGVRFWGRLDAHEPCWWFSVKGNGEVAYTSEARVTYHPCYNTKVTSALTRLSDPKD